MFPLILTTISPGPRWWASFARLQTYRTYGITQHRDIVALPSLKGGSSYKKVVGPGPSLGAQKGSFGRESFLQFG